MKERVFVAQPIPEVALEVLREVADVTVYPYLDRQITVDELVANAKRVDWLFIYHETNVTAEVINANPKLKGIGAMYQPSTRRHEGGDGAQASGRCGELRIPFPAYHRRLPT